MEAIIAGLSSFGKGPEDDFKRTKDKLIKHMSSIAEEAVSILRVIDAAKGTFVEAENMSSAIQEECIAIQVRAIQEECIAIQVRAKKIKETVERKEMKISFIGRTSSGKSTVINALIEDELLPVGKGHVTNCFICIKGINEKHGYLTIDNDSTKHEAIKKVIKLASAQNESSTKHAAAFHVLLPKTEYKVLAYDLVIIDSPGIDVDPELDKGISKYCDDSDVFVLVVNGEICLTMIEKNFLLRVKDTLSTPNIFILVNRWDLCENDEKTLKTQHQNKARELLECVYGKTAKHYRVFFVSASRKLESIKQATSKAREGTADEFDEFRKMLMDFVTRHAVESKCEAHIRSGQSMCVELQNVLKKMEDYFGKEREICVNLKTKMKRLMVTKREMSVELEELVRKIRGLVEESLMNENVRQLIQNKGLDEKEFDKNNLNEYKKTLCKRMKLQMSANIWSYCKQDMNERRKETVDILKEKVDEVGKILSFDLFFKSKGGVALTNLSNQPVTYDDVLTAFREDVSFKINPWICACVAIPCAIVCPVVSAGGLSIAVAASVAGCSIGVAVSLAGQYMYVTAHVREVIENKFVENANKNFKNLTQETAKLISSEIGRNLSAELKEVMKHFEGSERKLKEQEREADKRLKHLEQLIKDASLKRTCVQELDLEFQKLAKEAERLKQNAKTVSDTNSKESAQTNNTII